MIEDTIKKDKVIAITSYCNKNGLKFKVKDFGMVYQNQLDELIINNLVKLH